MSAPRPDSTTLQPPANPPPADELAALATLDEPNRRRLYDLVAGSHTEVSRDRAADELGMSRELVAFHLDRLVDAGLLRATYRRLTGRTGPGAGRPAKLYARTDREIALTLPPRRYESLAELFADGLQRLESDAGHGSAVSAVAAAARERGRAAGAALRAAVGRRPGRRRLADGLLRLLAERGYEPEADGRGTVTLCNCPYRAVAEAHRDLTCGANLAWAEGLVGEAPAPGVKAVFDPQAGRCCVRFAEP